MYFDEYLSPIGRILLQGDQDGLKRIMISQSPDPQWQYNDKLFMEIKEELDHYFSGNLTSFKSAVTLQGSPFQQKVYRALIEIPFGETRSYRDIAEAIGHPRAYRAVGNTNRLNPLPIIVPCHRVIGSNEKLVGFSCGIEKKEWLLRHEQCNAIPAPQHNDKKLQYFQSV